MCQKYRLYCVRIVVFFLFVLTSVQAKDVTSVKEQSSQKKDTTEEPNGSESFQSLFKKAQAGDSNAEVSIGHAFEFGKNVKILHEAFNWYHRAAEQGDSTAQWRLGRMYALGNGVKRNNSEALIWAEKSAKKRR